MLSKRTSVCLFAPCVLCFCVFRVSVLLVVLSCVLCVVCRYIAECKSSPTKEKEKEREKEGKADKDKDKDREKEKEAHAGIVKHVQQLAARVQFPGGMGNRGDERTSRDRRNLALKIYFRFVCVLSFCFCLLSFAFGMLTVCF